MNDNLKLAHNECHKAHSALALGNCTSTAVFMEAFRTNGQDFGKAVIAALATLGGIHAPIRQAYRFLATYDKAQALPKRVPGWGSDFVKGERDKSLDGWAKSIFLCDGDFFEERIANVTDRLHAAGKEIFPNAACYTAATALLLNFPEETAEYLLIEPRLSTWSGLANNALNLDHDQIIPAEEAVQRPNEMGESEGLEN